MSKEFEKSIKVVNAGVSGAFSRPNPLYNAETGHVSLLSDPRRGIYDKSVLGQFIDKEVKNKYPNLGGGAFGNAREADEFFYPEHMRVLKAQEESLARNSTTGQHKSDYSLELLNELNSNGDESNEHN